MGLGFDRGSEFTFLGTIPAPHHEFWIYRYISVFNHQMRASNAVMVMGRGCRYVGGYSVAVWPIAVRGNDILFDAPASEGNVIHFSHRLPPMRAWVAGEIPSFYH